MQEKIEKISKIILDEINKAKTLLELEDLRVKALGKKSELQQLQKTVGSLLADVRPVIGKLMNEVKRSISDALNGKMEILNKEAISNQLESEKIDVTIPGRDSGFGRVHPITMVSRKVFKIFSQMGFSVLDGPEVEEEYYNFDALNIPESHPAREDHDSFYLGADKLLRTQTSPMQIRTYKKFKPPVAAISPGKCFRRDTVDATHSHTFFQVEGFLVDAGVSMSDLKGILTTFAHQMFGTDTKIRFRPDFFPFTEPSAEIAISCFNCGGKGCKICSNTGWIEIGGAGMIHPEVFKAVGYDYEKYSGFAFGMGIDRIAMKEYNIPDIRMLYDNDMRVLEQF